jgi:hypothetical protein
MTEKTDMRIFMKNFIRIWAVMQIMKAMTECLFNECIKSPPPGYTTDIVRRDFFMPNNYANQSALLTEDEIRKKLLPGEIGGSFEIHDEIASTNTRARSCSI